MTDLKPLPKGVKGWKVRRIELLVMDVMSRATQPNTGWAVWQKMKRKYTFTGDDICEVMQHLSQRGYLEITGSDSDGDWFFKLAGVNQND